MRKRRADPSFRALCHERTRRWRENNKKHISEYNKLYKSKHASHILAYSKEYWAATEYYKRHADSLKERARKWRVNNPERDSANHRAKRGRKRQQSDRTVTGDSIRQLVESVKECPYCGDRLNNRNRHLDHKQPLVLGGAHSIYNLTPCCAGCNLRKNDMPYNQWLLKCDRRADGVNLSR